MWRPHWLTTGNKCPSVLHSPHLWDRPRIMPSTKGLLEECSRCLLPAQMPFIRPLHPAPAAKGSLWPPFSENYSQPTEPPPQMSEMSERFLASSPWAPHCQCLPDAGRGLIKASFPPGGSNVGLFMLQSLLWGQASPLPGSHPRLTYPSAPPLQ